MAENRVNRENFIALQGFMIRDLHLKGNELIIYACIYGFSQAENQVFNGSLQYLADWTNSTKQGVLKCLKSLTEKGYLEKTDKIINGVKFCEYRATDLTTVLNKVEYPIKQSLTGGIKQSSPNIIYSNNKEKESNIYRQVITHLNDKAGTSYKATSQATQRYINARIADGYTVEDFYTVIDKKCAEWKGTDMEKYIRPETLFGSKFEGYLNQKAAAQTKNNGWSMSQEEDSLDDLF